MITKRALIRAGINTLLEDALLTGWFFAHGMASRICLALLAGIVIAKVELLALTSLPVPPWRRRR